MPRGTHITLGRLAQLSPEDLKAEWTRRYCAAAPNLAPELLRLGIGFRLQEQRLGGISRSTRTMLRQSLAREGSGEVKLPLPRKLTPGTRLVRDWHGTLGAYVRGLS